MKTPQADDGLLRPSLEGYEPPGSGGGPPPWHLNAQVYIAFLGGPLAATIIAWLNAGRLGMHHRTRVAILAVGLIGTIAAVAVVTRLTIGADRELLSYVKIGWRASGIILFGIFYPMQKSIDRIYQAALPRKAVYASLWVPGIAIVVGASLVNFLLMAAGSRYWAATP